jgi:hypothetical protein
MKRWNQRGSVHAKRRMSELRDRQLDIRKSIAIDAWATATGKDANAWWTEAQAAGITHQHSQLERIQWLESAAS